MATPLSHFLECGKKTTNMQLHNQWHFMKTKSLYLYTWKIVRMTNLLSFDRVRWKGGGARWVRVNVKLQSFTANAFSRFFQTFCGRRSSPEVGTSRNADFQLRFINFSGSFFWCKSISFKSQHLDSKECYCISKNTTQFVRNMQVVAFIHCGYENKLCMCISQYTFLNKWVYKPHTKNRIIVGMNFVVVEKKQLQK